MAFGGWTPDYLDVTMWTDYFGLGDRSIAFRMRFQNEEANKLATEIRTTSIRPACGRHREDSGSLHGRNALHHALPDPEGACVPQ